jgi:hypothetical protein
MYENRINRESADEILENLGQVQQDKIDLEISNSKKILLEEENKSEVEKFLF